MALTGFLKSCTRRSGGVRTIQLAMADSIDTVSYNQATDSYSNITFSTGSLLRYEFQEDCASFVETATITDGSCCVEHQLTFALGKADSESRKAVEELIEASYAGIVAVVTTNCGDSFLVGYSQEFGNERPMRLVKGTAQSGQKLKEFNSHSVTLFSDDVCYARAYNL